MISRASVFWAWLFVSSFMLACEAPTTNNPSPTTSEDDSMREMHKVLGWSQSGVLQRGGVTGRASNGIIATPTVSLQANFEDQAEGSYTWVAQFSVSQPSNPNTGAGNTFLPLADLAWSVNGNDVRRTISIGNGTTIQGAAQAVRVIMRDSSTLVGPANPDGDQYGVSVQITKGTRPDTQQPPILQGPTVAINPGATSTIVVPTNAGVIGVMVTELAPTAGLEPANLAIFGHDAAGAVVLAFDPAINTDFVPLFGNVATLVLFNRDGAHLVNATVIWAIDG